MPYRTHLLSVVEQRAMDIERRYGSSQSSGEIFDMSEIANAHTPDFSPEISIRRFLSMLKNHRLFCLINHATCFSGWFLTSL